MTLVCTSCRRRFDLIVDTPYTRTLAAFLSQCPSCGGAVEALSTLITASVTTPTTLYVGFAGPLLSPPAPTVPYELPTVPYELTDADREFLRVKRIDPEI